MKTRIISVGCQLPQGPIEQHPFSFRPNVPLEDILLINPNQTPENYGYQSGKYHGKPCLTETLSEQILADKEFWENCILRRLMAGKNVYVFLEKPEEYYIHTGEIRRIKNGARNESFSLVSLFHTYSILPAEVGRPLPTTDLSPQSEVIDPMLRLLGSRFTSELIARAYYPAEEFGGKAGIVHPVSKQVLGGTVEVSNGRIILIPTLDLDRPEFLLNIEGKETWSELAKNLIEKFAKTILDIEANFVPAEVKKEAVRVSRFETPEDATLYGIDRKELPLTHKTGRLETQIHELNQKIEELKKEQDTLTRQLENKAREEQEPNKLLFESGAELERTLLKILNRLHFDPNAKVSQEASLEHSFVADETEWVLSTTATNQSSVDYEALDPLIQKSKEAFLKADVFPKAVLVANAFRDFDALNRGEFFTAKCIRFAAHHRIALVRALDLIPVYRYLRQNPKDLRFAGLCREALLKAEGKIVHFPSPPSKHVKLREAPRRATTFGATFGHAKLW